MPSRNSCAWCAAGCGTWPSISGAAPPTFGRHVAVELTEENRLQLFIPRGFAHGFAVLSPEAVFQYKCDAFYAPESEGAVAWDDPALAIPWPLPADRVVLSDKDRSHPLLSQCGALFDYHTDYYA